VNTPVPALPSSVEPRLGAIVMRLLSKDPADRPRSAADLAHMLDAMVEQTPPTGVHIVVPDPRLVPSGRRAATSVGVTHAPTVVPAPVRPPARPQAPVNVPPALPPSYTPRRELRDQRETEARRPAASHRATPPPPRRTSTTTGARVGRLTWPFVALVLLLIALLGAALANAVMRADGVPGRPVVSTVLAVAERDLQAGRHGYPRASPEDGMITVRVPSSSGILTTAKDS
jgi:hypothetical protein